MIFLTRGESYTSRPQRWGIESETAKTMEGITIETTRKTDGGCNIHTNEKLLVYGELSGIRMQGTHSAESF